MDESHNSWENWQRVLLHQDVIYEKMQRKNMDIMVPLRKLWEALKTACTEQDSSVSISDFIKFEITQSIILVEQTNITLSYHRRLSALDDVKKSIILTNSMLKSKSKVVWDLFGKEFCEQISETTKAYK